MSVTTFPSQGLTKAQIESAQAALKAALDPMKSEGARVTLSPVLLGPLSKGEFQIFHAGSRHQQPSQRSFNGPWIALRTVQFRGNLVLKDLRNPEAATPLLEEAKRLVTGLKLFGDQLFARYDGAIYPVNDSFTRLSDEAFWYYTLLLECEVEDTYPLPYTA